MQLTQHFTLEALCASSTATRLEIDNTPPDELLPNAHRLAEGLEAVRMLLGNRQLHIDSGYRCEALNNAIRGKKTSQHLQFLALDFVCPDFGTPADIVKTLAATSILFDQLIEEGTWVHISFSETPRREVLAATFKNGVPMYTRIG